MVSGISRGAATTTAPATDEKVPFVRDEHLLHALDLLILYLRMVHSIDFYGHIEYPNEDAMPNRCGMLHVRGVLPTQFGTAEDGAKLVSTKFNTVRKVWVSSSCQAHARLLLSNYSFILSITTAKRETLS
ncbi:unnamed protein product [Strongylus vulgaris]|uniref:Uncharacterized protein n=1 Tax=Strongylus vulgaris TaxID=40348 RepID=A0A3P7KCG4_STRVU|nr:unnamed protein product [Strongylus vulgaris]